MDSSDDVSALADKYPSTLLSLLDKHAPLRRRSITLRPAAPWYSEKINKEKVERRKLERQWRATGLAVHRELYVNQCTLVNELIFSVQDELLLRCY